MTPMPRKTRRVVLAIVLGLAAVVGLAAGAATWLVSSDAGTRVVLERVGELMPGKVELGSVDGSIRGPLRLEGVVYERDGMRLEIDRLLLRWRPRALLRRQLEVEELAADGVRVATSPAAAIESEEPFELPQIDLPVNLAVLKASVRDASIVVAGGEPIRIRSADLVTSSRGDALVIERFDLDSPDLALEVSGSLTPLGAYPVDLDLDWALAAPDGRRYRGAGTLDGTLEALRVRQRLTEPFEAVVEATLLDPLDDLRFEGGVEASGIALQRLDPSWPAMLVSADLAAAGSLDDLTASGRVRIESEEYGRVDADVSLRGGGERWSIERLRLRSDGSGATVTATGSIELGETPRFDVEAGWTDLRWPLAAPPATATMLAPAGSLRVRGTLESYRLDGSARLALPGVDAPATVPLAIDARLAVAGDRTGARIERFAGRALGGHVSGSGSVSWSPEVEWRLALRGDGLRPGLIEPRLDGELDAAIATSGVMTADGPRGSIVLTSVDGALHGQAVHGRGRLELDGAQYRIPDLRLTWGDAALAASGIVAETLDLALRVDAPDLGKLLADASGSLSLEGTVEGPRAAPGVHARLEGSSLRFGTLFAKSVAGTVSAGTRPDDPFEVALSAESASYGEREFPVARLSATGSRAAHTLEAALDGRGPPLERIEVRARGGLDLQRWRGSIERLVYAPGREQVWTLAGPAAVSIAVGTDPESAAASPARDRIQADFCLRNGGQRACVDASFTSAEDWGVEAQATDFALESVAKFYRDELDLRGAVSATISARGGAAGAVSGRAVVRSPSGSFVVPGETATVGRRAYRDASIELVASEQGTRADAELEVVDVGTVSGFAELPRWSVLGMPPREQPVRGRFVARVSSLEPVLLVSDTFARPRGRLDADLSIEGTVGAPLLRGSARLRDGSAFVVPLGIDAREISIDAAPSPSGKELSIAGSLRSGDGVLEIRGRAPLDARDILASIELSGENVLVMDLPERRIEASTDELTVVWRTNGIEAFGDVRIPEARIVIGEDRPEAVSASPDVVFVRLPPGSERAPGGDLALRARIRVLFGDDVEVSGGGLEAAVTGNLLVIEKPGTVTRATGELDLGGGKFAAYGARLEIERGRLVFADSPITSPAVDLRASRQAGDVVAGIEARGTLDNPRVTLWSEPPMPQAEQLSYLVLGRPINDVGAQEGDTLTHAAQSLGLRGGRYLAKRMGALFGLEEARIDTGEGGFEQASLVLGKFLSPRLYVAYGVGLFDSGSNSLLVRYLLSKKLTLEATTGENTRADVLYVVETGPGEARPKLSPELPDRD